MWVNGWLFCQLVNKDWKSRTQGFVCVQLCECLCGMGYEYACLAVLKWMCWNGYEGVFVIVLLAVVWCAMFLSFEMDQISSLNLLCSNQQLHPSLGLLKRGFTFSPQRLFIDFSVFFLLLFYTFSGVPLTYLSLVVGRASISRFPKRSLFCLCCSVHSLSARASEVHTTISQHSLRVPV